MGGTQGGWSIQTDRGSAPAWFKSKLERPYQEQESKRELAEAFRDIRRLRGDDKARVLIPDASNGRAYSGVVAVTDKHVLQRLSAEVYLAHDRLFTPNHEYRVGQQAQIGYAYQGGKLIDRTIGRVPIDDLNPGRLLPRNGLPHSAAVRSAAFFV